MRKKKNKLQKKWPENGSFSFSSTLFYGQKICKEILDKTHFTFSWHKFHFLYI